MSSIQHLIHGKPVSGDERTADVFNPSTGQVIHQVPLASTRTVQLAIDSARKAFPAWRNTPPAKRAQVMFRFKQLLEQNEAQIARLISEEHGKTLEDAAGELKRGIENVEFACAAPEILKGEYSRNVGPNIDAWSDFQPLGVVAGITPFNFPAMVPLWMYPLAIACGNCFIRPVAAGSRLAAGSVECGAWRQGSGGCADRSARGEGLELRRFHADRRVHL
jgi:malonate-semialdehyde dehydrogenase (acetylating)/methylmalonate-semialdehyde dehydrogenase